MNTAFGQRAIDVSVANPSRSQPTKTQFQMRMAAELWLNIGGKDFRLIGKSIRIGRSPDNDIVLDHKSCSRYHALISIQNNSVIIEDLKSRNGIKLNNAPVRRAELRENDQIKIGDLIGVFFYRQKKNSPSTASLLNPFDSKNNPAAGNSFKNLAPLVMGLKSKITPASIQKIDRRKKMVLAAFAVCAVAALYMLLGGSDTRQASIVASVAPDVFSKAVLKPVDNQVFEKCVELEDLGNFREANKCLKALPQTTDVQIALERVQKRQTELAQKEYAEGAQAFENFYFDIASLKWQEVLLIADDNSELYVKAKQGLKDLESRKQAEQ